MYFCIATLKWKSWVPTTLMKKILLVSKQTHMFVDPLKKEVSFGIYNKFTNWTVTVKSDSAIEF